MNTILNLFFKSSIRCGRFFLVLSIILINSACATVNAWEKGYLANAEMRFGGDKLAAKNTDHIYVSKEASSGGVGVGGGGCGCN